MKKIFFFNSLLYYGRLKSPLSIPQSKNFLPLKLREILLIRTTLYKITPKFHFRLLYQGKIFFLFRLAIYIYVIKVGIYHRNFFYFSYKKIFYLNETKFRLSRTIMTKRFFFQIGTKIATLIPISYWINQIKLKAWNMLEMLVNRLFVTKKYIFYQNFIIIHGNFLIMSIWTFWGYSERIRRKLVRFKY